MKTFKSLLSESKKLNEEASVDIAKIDVSLQKILDGKKILYADYEESMDALLIELDVLNLKSSDIRSLLSKGLEQIQTSKGKSVSLVFGKGKKLFRR